MSTAPLDALRITNSPDLRLRNTFGVPARARCLIEVDHVAALQQAQAQGFIDADTLVLGGGSNLLWVGDHPGSVLAMCNRSISMREADDGSVRVHADAGVAWHDLVMHTVAQGLSGLENLALIPGTVGAAPIQNIGAYGVEVGEHIVQVQAMQRSDGALVQLSADECAFAYRDSVFKQQAQRWIVTGVEFALRRDASPRLEYAGLSEALAALAQAPTPRDVAEAVIAIRKQKLPDPALLGNAGSFFKNPIVPLAQAQALAEQHPGMPVFAAGAASDRRKLSAAWLIDACGLKGYRQGDAGISAQHALVLVNHGNASGAELLAVARHVAACVAQRFAVAIEPEPRLIGAVW